VKSCCPPPTNSLTKPLAQELNNNLTVQSNALPEVVQLEGGVFTMGTDSKEGFAEDGEGPARRVTIGKFAISIATVSIREFREFIRATHYITQAEQIGTSFVFYLQIPETQRVHQRHVSRDLPWWLQVDGACWQRPTGPGSNIHDSLDNPVVHISWNDALAYCDWAKMRLPTEAEWEYAAKAGQTYRLPWGDELMLNGRLPCNIWQGKFPNAPTQGWTPGTVPVRSYAPNAWGIYQTSGNVWEWCADWFSPNYHQQTKEVDPFYDRPTGKKSMRGGSFLCHDSYCNRYRLAARGFNTPETSTSNIGFRVAVS
jgi:sulfatase modifying factor 1